MNTPASNEYRDGAGAVGNFATYTSSQRQLSDSRTSLLSELSQPGRVQRDDDVTTSRVFRRLYIDEVDSAIVDKFGPGFSNNSECRLAVESLEAIVRKKQNDRESDMYPHLATLFRNIVGSSSSQRSFTQLKKIDSSDANPTSNIGEGLVPDFTLSRIAPPENVNPRSSDFWRNQFAWVEVKLSPNEGPFSSSSLALQSKTGGQTADYARMHLSMSPFRLFSVAVIVFGMNFCAAIFDRDGVVFSPVLRIIDHSEQFIRLIYSVAVTLDEVQLGFDPTVTLAPPGSFFFDDYPSYIIPPLSPDTSYWVTRGQPKWTSVSLLGRGTSIWEVAELKSKDDREVGSMILSQTSKNFDSRYFTVGSKLYILKNAWRRKNRDSESRVYEQIKAFGNHIGLAEWIAGYDVPDISVASLRGDKTSVNITQILHRLVIGPVGKPLWEFESELELLKGFKMALEAHQWLCENNIIHRDISPGNIFLSHDADDGRYGFLADVEYARLPDEIKTTVNIPAAEANAARAAYNATSGNAQQDVQQTKVKYLNPQRGGFLTGTLQFMAREVLEAIIADTPITQTGQHDVESFINVFSYSTLRYIVANKHASKHARAYFNKSLVAIFGRLTVREISISRSSGGALGWIFDIRNDLLETTLGSRLFSGSLLRLLGRMYDMLHDHHQYLARLHYASVAVDDPSNTTYTPIDTFPAAVHTQGHISHQNLLGILNQTIQEISSDTTT